VKRKAGRPHNLVRLRGFDARGEQILDASLSLQDYYDGLTPIIDRADARRGVVRLCGALWGSDGRLTQVFENTYDKRGALTASWAQHDDDTFVAPRLKPPRAS
jgi:hypothetical protein